MHRQMPEPSARCSAAKEYERLLAGFEAGHLTYREVLYEPGEQMRHVYFPSDCVVSLLTVVEGHRALEVGLVGREGMVLLALASHCAVAPWCREQDGRAHQVCPFLRESGTARRCSERCSNFTDTLMNQVTQTAACNRSTGRGGRTSAADDSRALAVRRNSISRKNLLPDMLGVRRAGVTAAASALQRRKTDPLPPRTIAISISGSRSLFLFLLPTRQDHGLAAAT